MRLGAARTLSIAAAVAMAACGGDGPAGAGDGSAFGDEAGVTTGVDTTDGVVRVRNAGRPPTWRLELVTEIGERGGTGEAGPAEFGRVTSVALAPDGRVLVADGGSDEIRVFGPDGAFLEGWGRSGEGPGEFGAPYSLGWMGDTLAVLDPAVGRIGLFDADGGWIGQLDYPGGVSGSPSMIRFYRAGPGELYAWRVVPGEEGVERRFQRYTPEGEEEAVPWLDGPEGRPSSSLTCPTPDGGLHFLQVPFAPEWIQAPAPGGRVAAAWTADYRIAFVSPDGDTVRTVTRQHEPAPVTGEEWEAALADYRAFRDEWSDVRCDPSMPDRPDAKPALSDLFYDDRGRLWVEAITAEGRRWDVFDGAGRLIGSIPAPARAERVVPYVREDRIVLVAEDEMGIQTVRVYERRRP